MHRVAKFFRLDSADRRLMVGTAGLSVITWLGLRLLPLHVLRRLLMSLVPPFGCSLGSRSLDGRMRWAFFVLGRCVPFARNCLLQALVAQAIFERASLPSRLRIGVTRNDDGRLRAHAWVEVHGQALIGGAGVERYTPLEGSGAAPR
jgi:hypothetical protein